MDETLEAKGVTFRTDGLSPESLAYLKGKLGRVHRRAKRRRNPLDWLLSAILPRDYRRVEVETRVRGRTLVVGCNAGLETLKLGAVGIDIDLEKLRIALDLRANAVGADARFLAASGAALPFATGSFDSVLSDNVVEHFPGEILPPHFREIHRILRPGGLYVFTTPNRIFEQPANDGHISLHSYAEWEEMTRAAGFRDIRTPRRRSGDLVDLAWKKACEIKAGGGGRRPMGISNKGVRMVTILATR